MQLAFILGRLPQLALKELETVASILPFRWSMTSIQAGIAVLKPEGTELDAAIEKEGFASQKFHELVAQAEDMQKRLGGTLRVVYLYKQCEKANVQNVLQELSAVLLNPDEGKANIGLSVYGTGIEGERLAWPLKRALKEQGFSVRVVLPKDGKELNTAQVLHNQMTFAKSKGKNAEFTLVQQDTQWWVGFTLTVQDVEEYTARDFGIPAPDPVSGMLSPKLAQIMINLATPGEQSTLIYDPFCGNGRILLEGTYMGHRTLGADIEEKKVTAARQNLQWLVERYDLPNVNPEEQIWVADATTTESRQKLPSDQPWYLVGEPYLGAPLRRPLSAHEKEGWLTNLLPLYESFFEVWAEQNGPRPQRMLLVIPRAKVEGGDEANLFTRLVDTLSRLGYSAEVLFCYDRPDSLVRRDLVQIEYRSNDRHGT